jgi:hypothetical protein
MIAVVGKAWNFVRDQNNFIEMVSVTSRIESTMKGGDLNSSFQKRASLYQEDSSTT